MGSLHGHNLCLLLKTSNHPIAGSDQKMKKNEHGNLFTLSLVLLSFLLGTPVQGQIEDKTIIYLVRHAEKIDNSSDAALSSVGRERAILLSKVLSDAQINYIHSTDLQRTRDTVEPLASLLELEVQLYNPEHLEDFSNILLKTPGRHLVSGHSNTTPELVRLLGGQSTAIQDHEYDRLYVIVRSKGQTGTTILIHYGTFL